MRRALIALCFLAPLLAPLASAAPASVTVSNFAFTPSAVTIQPGESVTWTWASGIHGVSFETPGSPADCPIQSSGTCVRDFPTAGTYSYHCPIHGSMTGTITVQAASANAAPVASFTLTMNGMVASVDASASSDAEGPIASYAWSWGDGTSTTGASASHEYLTPGDYTVTLTVTDSAGATGQASHTASAALGSIGTPPPEPSHPAANISLNVTYLRVIADGRASQNATAFLWTWGDGFNDTTARATHVYAAGGAYDITLTVTSATGETNSATQRVTLTPPPPDSPPRAVLTVRTTDRSVLANGSASLNATSFQWDWGDGTSTNDTAPVASHTYDRNGVFNVTLTVTNSTGAQNSTRQVVTAVGGSGAPAEATPGDTPPTGTETKGTPGFELALVVLALVLVTRVRGRNGRS
jgi:PKD repeat protein